MTKKKQDLWHIVNGRCSQRISMEVKPSVDELKTEGFEGLTRKEIIESLRINYREISRLPRLLTNRTYIGSDDYILFHDEKCASWIISEPLTNGYRKTLWLFKEGKESKPVYQVNDRGLKLVSMSTIEICVSEGITNTDWYLHYIRVD